jgi:predicted nucleic acid-binding protein
MIVVDSNIWIDFFRSGNIEGALARQIRAGSILVHPCVVGELALGNLGSSREDVLSRLALQPRPPILSDGELLDLVEERRLWGCGIGWVDAHLVGSAILAEADLWTNDRFLARAAIRCGIHLFAANGS